jgi:hypothetical protein
MPADHQTCVTLFWGDVQPINLHGTTETFHVMRWHYTYPRQRTALMLAWGRLRTAELGSSKSGVGIFDLNPDLPN